MKDIKIIERVEKNTKTYSTEGLKDLINKELLINISLDKTTAEYVLKNVADRVLNNETIEDKSFDTELLNCKIYFVHKKDNIVIVFPDKKMKYPWDDDCMKTFAQQI